MDEVIIKYLVGEAEAEETQLLNSWIAASPENEKEFFRYKKIWEASKVDQSNRSIDVDVAWNKVKEKLDGFNSNSVSLSPKSTSWAWKSLVAAMLVLTVGAGICYRIFFNAYDFQTDALVHTYTLDDQSEIVLNKHSKVKLASNFNEKERKVKLDGEAFFDVSKNPNKPFIIEANDVTVTVLGTSFNVHTSPKFTEVVVETGKVNVSKGLQQYDVTPNQRLIFYKGKNDAIVVDNTTKLYQYYRTHQFVCESTPVSDVVGTLQRAYDTKISIAHEDIANATITATFHTTQSLDAILNTIAQTLNAKVLLQNGGYILKY
jgi:transmembrane sensor